MVGSLARDVTGACGRNNQLPCWHRRRQRTRRYANNKSYLRIAARMAYVNRGQTGNDVIMQETVSYKLGNTTYEQRWQDYTESSGEGAKLDMNRKGDALPVSNSAGSATVHETWFAPRTVRKQGIHPGINFLEMDVFLKALEQQNELKLNFSFKTYGNSSGSMECRISVNDNLRGHLKNKGWSAPSCEIKS